ncbi:MAG: hypothetical protein ACRDXX_05935 [Stackebrandtia sp.]
MIATTNIPSKRALGAFTVARHWIAVYRHSEEALWLTLITATGNEESLGTVRWSSGSTPCLVFAPSSTRWVLPHSPLAELIVAKAMAVYRRAVLADDSEQQTADPRPVQVTSRYQP